MRRWGSIRGERATRRPKLDSCEYPKSAVLAAQCHDFSRLPAIPRRSQFQWPCEPPADALVCRGSDRIRLRLKLPFPMKKKTPDQRDWHERRIEDARKK